MKIEEGDAHGVVGDAEDDDNFTVDMSQVPDQMFQALPKGDYNVVIEMCEFSRSKSSNKPMWTVRVEVEDGEYAGKKIYTHLSFSDAAMPGTKMAIKTFAPEILSDPQYQPFAPKKLADEGYLLGKKARVRLGIEKYEGQDKNKIARWLEPTTAANQFIQPD